MNCLVFGGAGFIGSHLCDELVSTGYNVTIYDRLEAATENLHNIIGRYQMVTGDFCRENDFTTLLKDKDIVFHLVSTTTPRTSNVDMTGDISDNLLSTLRLIDACRYTNVKKVIFLSSGGTVYGNSSHVPIDEEQPTNPLCSYGIHKLAIEKYLLLYHNLYGLNVTILRAANPYGTRQNPLGTQGVIPVFLSRALLGQQLEVWGDGTIVRDFLQVHDLVRALLLSITYSRDCRVFNVGSGCGISIKGLISMLESVLNRHLEVSYKVANKLDVASNVLDISRISAELGWIPQIELRQGLTELSRDWLPMQKKFGH
jgi:UDP-glucose 4-epimerase